MAKSLSIKIAVLLTVVVLTRIATTELMARFEEQNQPAKLTVTKIIEDPTKPSAIPKGRKVPLESSSRLSKRSFKVQGNEVQIEASVDMMNKNKNSVYLWRLRAYRVSDKEMELDRPYVEQLFEMHSSGKMSPTFSETIQLPPGRHRVILTLYGVPKGYDLNELKDNDKARAAIQIEVPRVIDIQ